VLRRFGLILVRLIGHQQFGRDVKQRDPANDFQIRERHQRRDDPGENYAKSYRDTCTKDHAPNPLSMRQAAAGHCDHHRVVA
jgi:hypothetical protein